MLAEVPSATLLGVEGHRVLVEVHVGQGLPGFTVVGLPDASCREARDRVRAAVLSSKLKCSGFSFSYSHQLLQFTAILQRDLYLRMII